MTNKKDTQPIDVKDITSYLKKIFELPSIGDKVRCYRGHADTDWIMRPSAFRNLKKDAESRMLSELMLEVSAEFANDKSMFDKLIRAQHYGLPTRLLDVSLNPLVALFFACGGHQKKDGEVLIFDFKPERVKFADSDAISLISNLARLSEDEKNTLIEEYGSSKKEWTEKEIDAFRDLDAMQRLTQFVRVEKPYFLDKINPVDLRKYFFIHPPKNNPRVIAQSGAFVAAGLLGYKSPYSSEGFDTQRIHIPANSKKTIMKELDLININSRTMFPEIEFASKYIKEKWIS